MTQSLTRSLDAKNQPEPAGAAGIENYRGEVIQ